MLLARDVMVMARLPRLSLERVLHRLFMPRSMSPIILTIDTAERLAANGLERVDVDDVDAITHCHP